MMRYVPPTAVAISDRPPFLTQVSDADGAITVLPQVAEICP